MNMKIWILASIVILAIVFVLLAKQGRIRNKPNYYSLFIVGIMWATVGIPIGNEALTVSGIILTLIGLLNRSKWKENRSPWSDLSEEEKKDKIIIIVIVSFLLIAGIVIYLFQNSL